MNHAVAIAILGPGLETEEAIKNRWNILLKSTDPSDENRITQLARASEALIKEIGKLCGGPGKIRIEPIPWFNPALNKKPRLDPPQPEKPLLPQPKSRKPRAQPVPRIEGPSFEPPTNYELARLEQASKPHDAEVARLEQAAWYGIEQANVNNGTTVVIPPVVYHDLLDMPQATYNDPVLVVPPVEDQIEPTMSQDPEISDSSPESSPAPKKRTYKMNNRTPRAPDARVHKKKSTEKIFKEMQKVFSGHFEVKPGARVHPRELLNAFTSSRNAKGMSVSDDEKSSIKRHGKRFFMAQWPNTKFRLIKEGWLYTDVSKKKT